MVTFLLLLVLPLVCDASAVLKITKTKPKYFDGNKVLYQYTSLIYCSSGYVLHCLTFKEEMSYYFDDVEGGYLNVNSVGIIYSGGCVLEEPAEKNEKAYLFLNHCFEIYDINISEPDVEAKLVDGQWEQCNNNICEKSATGALYKMMWRIPLTGLAPVFEADDVLKVSKRRPRFLDRNEKDLKYTMQILCSPRYVMHCFEYEYEFYYPFPDFYGAYLAVRAVAVIHRYDTCPAQNPHESTQVAYIYLKSCYEIDDINIDTNEIEAKLNDGQWKYIDDNGFTKNSENQLGKTIWTIPSMILLPDFKPEDVLKVSKIRPKFLEIYRGVQEYMTQIKCTTGFVMHCFTYDREFYYHFADVEGGFLGVRSVAVIYKQDRCSSEEPPKENEVAYIFMNSCNEIDNINIDGNDVEALLNTGFWEHCNKNGCEKTASSSLTKTPWLFPSQLLPPVRNPKDVIKVTKKRPKLLSKRVGVQEFAAQTFCAPGYVMHCFQYDREFYYHFAGPDGGYVGVRAVAVINRFDTCPSLNIPSENEVAYLFMNSCYDVDDININIQELEVLLANGQWIYFDNEGSIGYFPTSRLAKTVWMIPKPPQPPPPPPGAPKAEGAAVVFKIKKTKPKFLEGNSKIFDHILQPWCAPGYVMHCYSYDEEFSYHFPEVDGGYITVNAVAIIYRYSPCTSDEIPDEMAEGYIFMSSCIGVDNINVSGRNVEALLNDGQWEQCNNNGCEKTHESKLKKLTWTVLE